MYEDEEGTRMNRPDADFQLSSTVRTSPPFKKISSFLKDNTLSVLQAGKESCFTVMTKGHFSKKSWLCISEELQENRFQLMETKENSIGINSVDPIGRFEASGKQDKERHLESIFHVQDAQSLLSTMCNCA